MTTPTDPTGTAAGEIPAVSVAPKVNHRTAIDKRSRSRALRRANGEIFDCDMLDPEPYRDIIKKRHDEGMTYNEMARITGIASESISFIARGRVSSIRRSTAKAIYKHLEVTPERRLLDNTKVPVTQRHIQIRMSLHAQGWTKEHLAEIIRNNGLGSGQIALNLLRYDTVYVGSLRQLITVAREIGDRTGPSTRSRAAMERRGIFPLRHYDKKGQLIESTLSPAQRESLRRVQSKHGASSSGSHGAGSRP